MSELVTAFHRHLDTCKRCREHPFDLCLGGYALLRTAAADGGVPPGLTPEVELEVVGRRSGES